MFSKLAVPFYMATSNVSSDFSTSLLTQLSILLITAILDSTFVVLIYISLMTSNV